MDFKLKLSDIIKYIALGLAVCVIFFLGFENAVDSQNKDVLEFMKSFEKGFYGRFLKHLKYLFESISFLGPILAIVFIYILGLIIQTIIRIIYGVTYCGMSISEVSFFIKKFGKYLGYDSPDWLFWSFRPDRVVMDLTEQTEIKLNSDTRSEWLILNQLFQGLHFISLIALCVAYIPLFSENRILVSIFGITVVLLLIFSRFFPTRPLLSLLANLSLIVTVMILLCITGSFNAFSIVKICPVILLLTYFCAIYYARKHILSMASVSVSDKESLNNILLAHGVPTAYILIRTNSDKYISDTLESISIQTYPNIKVIILEDKDASETIYDNVNIINKEKCEEKLDIIYYKSDVTGPYNLSVEIRDRFLDLSSDEDIAIILDSDDYFASNSVVSDIVTKMSEKDANICVSSFVPFGKMSLNYAKNYHNKLVKKLAKLRLPLTRSLYNSICHPNLIEDIHHISTIGWVKSYRRPILEKYKQLMDYGKEVYIERWNIELGNKYGNDIKVSKYEDFPDILVHLLKEAKIVAISSPSHRFRKEPGSVTTNGDVMNYKVHIPAFLILTGVIIKNAYKKEIASKNQEKSFKFNFVANADKIVVNQFIPYKLIQYWDIVKDKCSRGEIDLSGEAFIKLFKAWKIYGPNADTTVLDTLYDNDSALFDKLCNEEYCKHIKSKNIIDINLGSYAKR